MDLETLAKLDQARRLLKQNKKSVSREDVVEAALESLLEKKDPARKSERAKLRRMKKAQVGAATGQLTKKVNITAPGQQPESKRKNNAARPRKAASDEIMSRPLQRYIPAKTRYLIHGGRHRCQFTSHEGRQCQETRSLQIDHIKMFCKGGGHDADNLRLLCASHNRYVADQELGRS